MITMISFIKKLVGDRRNTEDNNKSLLVAAASEHREATKGLRAILAIGDDGGEVQISAFDEFLKRAEK